MTIDNTRLRARWGWTTVLALTVMAVLGGLDAQIKAASGYGILDLEFTSAASGVNAIMSAWEQAGMLAQMGFLMGLDYLYMPAYGFSLFYGSLAAREAFAKDGAARRILTVLAFAPLLGAGFDVIENALEAKMLFTGATDPMALTLTIEVEHLLELGLDELNEREREVLAGRYGLRDREPETLEVLAERLNLTRERIRQIQQEALVKLKRQMLRNGIGRDSIF